MLFEEWLVQMFLNMTVNMQLMCKWREVPFFISFMKTQSTFYDETNSSFSSKGQRGWKVVMRS